MFTMLEEYSAAYYITRVSVEPGEHERALLEEQLHRRLVETVYTTGFGIDRLDVPVLVKLAGHYLPVFASDAVPLGTLAIRPDVLEETPIESPPTVTEILVTKAERACQLLEWFTPYTVPERPSV